MRHFYRKRERLVSAVIVSFALGFASAFLLTKYYDNLASVGNYCSEVASKAGKFLGVF